MARAAVAAENVRKNTEPQKVLVLDPRTQMFVAQKTDQIKKSRSPVLSHANSSSSGSLNN